MDIPRGTLISSYSASATQQSQQPHCFGGLTCILLDNLSRPQNAQPARREAVAQLDLPLVNDAFAYAYQQRAGARTR